MQTIYEDEFYIVRVSEGNDDTEYVVCSFTGVAAPERENGECFGSSLARNLHIPWVGIIAKTDSWYRAPGFSKVIDQVNVWVAERTSRITRKNVSIIGYGISMGAYASIKYSRILRFDYTIALAPQYSIVPSDSDHESHFKNFFFAYMDGMKITADDIGGVVYAFYDPYETVDFLEIQMIKKYCARAC
ncbi:MAG: hypothetical protein ACTINM_03705 [Acetobacter cibinongensis]